MTEWQEYYCEIQTTLGRKIRYRYTLDCPWVAMRTIAVLAIPVSDQYKTIAP